MTTHNWIIATGTATWQSASFDSAALPATGDTVNIASGNADITAGLAQSAVLLAALNITGSFSGTIGTLTTQLAIGVSGTLLVNCQTSRCCIDIGSTTPLIVATNTGPSADDPLPALRIRGGGAGAKVYVAGDGTSVGTAIDKAGVTCTITEWDVDGGTLQVGAGTTWTNGYQSGGTAIVNSGGTLIVQTGDTATLLTQGSGVITTLTATGTATLNNRPAAGTDGFATISIGSGATVDFSTDPRPVTVTNAINMAKDSTLKAFNPQQVALHSASLQVKTQLCGLQDVTIEIGGPVLATLTNY